ncbi:MAG TPA: RidA family protein [Thermoanaerobaculia bacterium]|jgi:2-iminobutanoate/2-iminopropanoate deaminase|nr:RidA family protein [Thermoanaerobaculia bacterium]
MRAKKVIVESLGRLPAFCHAVVAGDFIYVSGTLGTLPGGLDLVEGGTREQTAQTLRNIETILRECGASLADLVKVNVFLSDMKTFPEMNAAYLEIIGSDPPARITVGRAELALGAAVEIDAVAYKPRT